MGHDIYARRVNAAEQDRLFAEHEARVPRYGANEAERDAWLASYDQYQKAVNVAYLRRSAFSPNNRLIYQALDAGKAYAGCSGSGMSLMFTRAKIERALAILPTCGARVGRNMAHDLLESLGGSAPENPAPDDDREPERKFLRAILDWMTAEGRDMVEIDFG